MEQEDVCKHCNQPIKKVKGVWLHSHVGDYGYWCWTTNAEPKHADMDELRDRLKAEDAAERNL